jgi:DNA-binding transcriptional LysR family regulator
MELRHLRCLLAVAEELHFARAAERLHIEQSPLSRAINELEEELGVLLFARTTRSTRLTRAGRMFMEHVPRVFTALQQARDSVKAAANGFHGQLRIALSEGITLSRFSAPAARYIAEFGRPTRPSDLAVHRKILFYDAAMARPYEWKMRQRDKLVDIGPIGPMLVSDVGTMINACLAGGGIAQILELGSKHLMASRQLVVLFPEWSDERLPPYVLYPLRRHSSAKVHAFIDFCISCLPDSAAAPAMP